MEFLRKNLKFVVGGAFFLFLGVVIGRETATPTVQIQEKVQIVEVEKQVVVEKEVVRVEVVRIKDTQTAERWHREKTEEKKPDGTILTREVEDRNIDTIIREQDKSVEVKVVEVEKQVVVQKDKLVYRDIKPVLPQWHIGLMGGVQARLLPSPGMEQWIVGGEVERRLVGPLWVGTWTMWSQQNQLFSGVKVSMEF